MSMQDFVNSLNDEQKKALLNALTNNNTTLSNVPQDVKEQTKTIIENNFTMSDRVYNSSYQKRREQVKAKKNLWVDTGESKEVTTPKVNPTPRTRQPVQKVKLKCHICSKEFEADKRFVYGEYNRCDRCASKK